MHLKRLENYIVQLGIRRVNSSTSVFIDSDEVIKDLMEILIHEESLIPDFVVDGDTLTDPGYYQSVDDFDIYDYELENDDDQFFGSDTNENYLRQYGDRMKKLALVLLGVCIGLTGFIVGFFVA